MNWEPGTLVITKVTQNVSGPGYSGYVVKDHGDAWLWHFEALDTDRPFTVTLPYWTQAGEATTENQAKEKVEALVAEYLETERGKRAQAAWAALHDRLKGMGL